MGTCLCWGRDVILRYAILTSRHIMLRLLHDVIIGIGCSNPKPAVCLWPWEVDEEGTSLQKPVSMRLKDPEEAPGFRLTQLTIVAISEANKWAEDLLNFSFPL